MRASGWVALAFFGAMLGVVLFVMHNLPLIPFAHMEPKLPALEDDPRRPPAGPRPIRMIRTQGGVTTIAWSPDSHTIASVSDFGQSVDIWGIDEKHHAKLNVQLQAYTKRSLGFIEGGRFLLTSPARVPGIANRSALSAFSAIEPSTGEIAFNIDGPMQGEPYAYAVSPDGRTVLFATIRDNTLHFAVSPDWRVVRTVPLQRGSAGHMVRFSADGRIAVVATSRGALIFDMNAPEKEPAFLKAAAPEGVFALINAVAISPDGRMVALGIGRASKPNPEPNGSPLSVDADAEVDPIQIWRIDDQVLAASIPRNGTFSPKDMEWNAGGTRLAVAIGKQLRFYDPARPDRPSTTLELDSHVYAIAHSPDGSKLAVAMGNRLLVYPSDF